MRRGRQVLEIVGRFCDRPARLEVLPACLSQCTGQRLVESAAGNGAGT